MEIKKLPSLENLGLKNRRIDINKTNTNISSDAVSNYREEHQLGNNVEVEIILTFVQILKYFIITFFFVCFFSSFFFAQQ